MSTNYSVYTIPAYWLLSIMPHTYSIFYVMKHNNRKWSYASPNSSTHHANIQKSVPTACWNKFERLRSAHRNGMENLPLVVAAVVLGNMAKLDPGRMNFVLGTFLATRAAYTVVYAQVENEKLSIFRTVLFFTGLGELLYLIVGAGNILANAS